MHVVRLHLVEHGGEDAVGRLTVAVLQRHNTASIVQKVNELDQFDAPGDDGFLGAANLVLQRRQLLFLEERVARQCNCNTQLLSGRINVHLARCAERVQHVISDEEVLLHLGRITLLLGLDGVLDLCRLVDEALEVLAEEHEHVLRAAHLLSRVNHEQDLLVVQILLVHADLAVALAVEAIERMLAGLHGHYFGKSVVQEIEHFLFGDWMALFFRVFIPVPPASGAATTPPGAVREVGGLRSETIIAEEILHFCL